DLGPTLHALVCLRQHPKLARKVGALDEVRLVVVRAAIENVQAHAGAAKLRRQPDPVAIPRYHDVPELAREVATIDEVWLVVFRATVKIVQADAGAAKQSQKAKRAVAIAHESPELPRDILIRLQPRQVVLRPAVEHIELHSVPAKLGAQLV